MRWRLVFKIIIAAIVLGIWTNGAHAQWKWPSQTEGQTEPTGGAKDSSFQDLVKRNLEFRKELKDLETRYKALEDQRNVLILHVKELKKENERFTETIRDLQEGIGESPALKAKLKDLNKSLDEVTKERDRLQKKLAVSDQRVTKEKFDDLNRELDLVSQEKERLQKELDKIRKEPAGTDSLISKGESRDPQRLEEKIRQTEERTKKAEAQVKKLEDQFKEELRDARLAFEQKEDKLKAENQKVSAEGKDVQAHLVRVQKENAALETKLQKLEKRAAVAVKDNRELAEKIKRQEAARASQEKQFEAENRKLLADNKSLKADLQRSQDEQEDAEKKRQLLVQTLQSEKTKVDELVKQIKKELQAAQGRFFEQEKKLKADNQKNLAEKISIQQDLEGLIHELDTADREYRLLENELYSTQARLQELEEEVEMQDYMRRQQISQVGKLKDSTDRSQYRDRTERRQRPWETQRLPEPVIESVKSEDDEDEEVKQRRDLHYNLAIAYHNTGKFKKEEKEYLKCLQISPDDADVHYNLGILYDDKLNNNAEAINHYKRFIDLRPIGEDASRVREWMLHAEQEMRIGGSGIR